MKINDYLNEIAILMEPKFSLEIVNKNFAYYTKNTGVYLCSKGFEESIKFLADREIIFIEQICLGFSEKDNKWYGWSNKAIFGFTIGSECRTGNSHYTPSSIELHIANLLSWGFDANVDAIILSKIENNIIYIEKILDNYNYNKTLNIKSIINEYKIDELPFGKGEWIAKTMEDAKQMAIDFARSVS